MPEPEFGFDCGSFSVALSRNDIIFPGSRNALLSKSLLPLLPIQESAGAYTLRITHGGDVVCDLPVQVLWVGHKSQPEPFLGSRSDNTRELLDALRPYKGRAISLAFTRRVH